MLVCWVFSALLYLLWCCPLSLFFYPFTDNNIQYPLLLSAISWSYQSISPPSLFKVQSVFIHLSSGDWTVCQWVTSGVKDGGVTEQRGSLVLYTCTESGLRALSLGSWSRDCDVCVWDKDTVGALRETVERTWQTTCGMVVSLHLAELLILARLCLAAALSQSLSVSEQPRSTIHGAPPCTAAFIFLFPPIHFGVLAGRQWHFFSWGWGMRANRRQAGVIGARGGGCWGTPAVEFLKLLPFIFVTLCLPSHHLPPSLTVPCPSASCRFLIKENISLMPLPTSNPPLIPSYPLTPSSSVLSFISPPLPREATWLTSISLSLESASWASVCARRAQTKCFSILLYFFSLFIPPWIWELLSWTLLSHETGGKLQ